MKRMTAGKIVYEFFMTAYFQMLGNFGLDILEGEGNAILHILKCIYKSVIFHAEIVSSPSSSIVHGL